jgi:arylsulfatase A-like enzyme
VSLFGRKLSNSIADSRRLALCGGLSAALLLTLGPLTGCDGVGGSSHRLIRLDTVAAEKREIAREVRAVLEGDGPHVFDLRAHRNCELVLGAAPPDPTGAKVLRARLRGEDGSTLGEYDFAIPVEATPDAAESDEVQDYADASDPDPVSGWVDRLIPLDDPRIADVELRMPPAGGAWSRPLLSCPSDESDRRWNVIMVSLDTLRADRLGVYGSSKNLTPSLDRFAHRSVVFENAFTTFPNTLAAHASLFTGYHPSQHGLLVDSAARLPKTANTLAAHFAEQGYSTVGFTENAYVSSDLGFDVGFDRYHNGPDGEGDELFPGVARQTFARGIEWLQDRPSAPFFLFLHTYEVHTPYTPTWRARQLRLKAEGMSYEGEFDTWFGGMGEIVFNRRERTFTPAELAQIERLYDGEVTILDEVVERFLMDLKPLGLLRDTIIVFFSDHGEEFNEHGYLGHGETLHDQAIRISLIVHTPVAMARSRRITEPVSIIDVAATVADLAALPAFAPEGPGRNLADWIRGEQRPTVAPVFSELDKTDASCRDHLQGDLAHCAHGGLSIRDDKYVYIRSKELGWERLYDLRKDPTERVDISDEYEDLVATYRDLASKHEQDMAKSTLPTSTATLAPATAEKLKALGYVE